MICHVMMMMMMMMTHEPSTLPPEHAFLSMRCACGVCTPSKERKKEVVGVVGALLPHVIIIIIITPMHNFLNLRPHHQTSCG